MTRDPRSASEESEMFGRRIVAVARMAVAAHWLQALALSPADAQDSQNTEDLATHEDLAFFRQQVSAGGAGDDRFTDEALPPTAASRDHSRRPS